MKLKTDLLRRIFEKESKSLDADKEYQQFVQDSKEWLAPYAVFCHFRDKYNTSDFSEWKENATVTKVYMINLVEHPSVYSSAFPRPLY